MRLHILATKYARSAEADEVFARRGWEKVCDQSKVPATRRVVRTIKKEFPLAIVEIEEIEYGER
jgi:hypothetical protein